MSSVGTLAVTVWPVYVGFGHHRDDDLPQDQRHQICWDTEAGMLTGHAHPAVEAGEYTHILYFHAPTGPPTFSAPFDHPVTLPAGRIHVGPILMHDDQITAQVH